MKQTLRLFALMVVIINCVKAQSPQFSQFYANPIYSNPALAGDAGTPRLIANYRNQWASVGTPFQTAAFSFDSYAEDFGVGLGIQALHDQRGSALQSDQIAAQASYLVPFGGQKNYRFIGGLQLAWTSNRWNGNNLTYVSQFLGSVDPLAMPGVNQNRISASIGGVFENVPGTDKDASYWISGAWHNIGVDDDISIEHQRINFQIGTRIPFTRDPFFTNYLGGDGYRESALTMSVQVRKQGTSRQLDAGFNVLNSPLILGLWYRGLLFGETRRDALIGTAGWAMGKMLVQASYDLPVSSLGFDTGAFEISIWYGIDAIFRFTGKGGQDRKSRKCLKY